MKTEDLIVGKFYSNNDYVELEFIAHRGNKFMFYTPISNEFISFFEFELQYLSPAKHGYDKSKLKYDKEHNVYVEPLGTLNDYMNVVDTFGTPVSQLKPMELLVHISDYLEAFKKDIQNEKH